MTRRRQSVKSKHSWVWCISGVVNVITLTFLF